MWSRRSRLPKLGHKPMRQRNDADEGVPNPLLEKAP